MKKCVLIGMLIAMATTTVLARPLNLDSNYTQAIHVMNLAANMDLSNVGMTPTTIIVKYFNGGRDACWWDKLDYQQDITIHAGPTQGCVDKVTRVTIEPVAVLDKLQVYDNMLTVTIDPMNFSNQLVVKQEKAPLFNKDNGLVLEPGKIKVNVVTAYTR